MAQKFREEVDNLAKRLVQHNTTSKPDDSSKMWERISNLENALKDTKATMEQSVAELQAACTTLRDEKKELKNELKRTTDKLAGADAVIRSFEGKPSYDTNLQKVNQLERSTTELAAELGRVKTTVEQCTKCVDAAVGCKSFSVVRRAV